MKIKQLKRALSILITSAVVMGSTPVSLMAEEPQATETPAPTETPAAETAETPVAAPTTAPETKTEETTKPAETAAAEETKPAETAEDKTEAAESKEDASEVTEAEVSPTVTPEAEASVTPEATPSVTPEATPTPTEAKTKLKVTWSGVKGNIVQDSKVENITATVQIDDQDINLKIEGIDSKPGDYTLTASLGSDIDSTKYELDTTTNTCNVRVYHVITSKEITWDVPELTYTGSDLSNEIPVPTYNLDSNVICGFETKNGEIIQDAGNYELKVTCKSNYYVVNDSITKTVKVDKAKVTISPDNISKTYGEKDPELTYTLEEIDKNKVENELEGLLVRKDGELPGEYEYKLKDATDDTVETDNLIVALNATDEKFIINPITITGISDINADTTSFTVTVGSALEVQEINPTVKVTVEDEYTNNSITVSNIKNCIGTSTLLEKEFTVPIELSAKYSYSNGSALWTRGLPAGTELTVKIMDGENVVSEESKSVTVGKISEKASLSIGAWPSGTVDKDKYKYIVPKAGGTVNISASDYAGPIYVADVNGSYEALGSHKLNGAANTETTITASIVDIINYNEASTSATYVIDTEAQTIPSSNIQYSNRDSQITITLPEEGTIETVTIPNGTVSVDNTQGTSFTFPVSFSGTNLITTGSDITVTYKDLVGNEGTGSSSAARSTVGTALEFSLTPETNSEGYLHGQEGSLIITGSGCSCEPITVNVGGTSYSTYVTQTATWSDSAGTFEITVPMSSLPEGDFTISAEYVDVDGPSKSMDVKYDSYVAPAVVTSPVYDGMSQIAGMAEDDASVILIINGDNANVYKLEKDAFGRFSADLNELSQNLSAGDYFEIRVTDIAGNQNSTRYDIAEAGDPFEVTSTLSPIGKIIFTADENSSEAYMAAQVSADSLGEDGTLELPLLYGSVFKVGSMTLNKTDNGFTVSTTISMDAGDYTIQNDKIYVYTSQPSVSDIKNHTNCTEYASGDEIKTSGQVWITMSNEMVIDETFGAIEDLDLYDYANTGSEDYQLYAGMQQ